MRDRKTYDEFQIHGLYVYGWEEVTCELSYSEAKKRITEYRKNEPYISFKIIKKRIKK